MATHIPTFEPCIDCGSRRGTVELMHPDTGQPADPRRFYCVACHAVWFEGYRKIGLTKAELAKLSHHWYCVDSVAEAHVA